MFTSATLSANGDFGHFQRQLGLADAQTLALDSPFDYAGCSEVLIVTDVRQGDIAALAGAYARLIETAEGGTLGLFTAIQRLKSVHAWIAGRGPGPVMHLPVADADIEQAILAVLSGGQVAPRWDGVRDALDPRLDSPFDTTA